MNDLSNQELEDRIEILYARLIKAMIEAEARTCDAAPALGDKGLMANAYTTDALGLLMQSKAQATIAGKYIPDVSVRFGGK